MLAELGPTEVVQHLLNGNTTDRSLPKVPSYAAQHGAPLLCDNLAKVSGEEGQQEGSKSACQAHLQPEKHLTSCHHVHQVPVSDVANSRTSFVHSK